MTAFNINNHATVRLTDYGRQVLATYIAGELDGLTRLYQRTCPDTWQVEVDKMATYFRAEFAVDDDGSVTQQFWKLMHIFRGEFHMGSRGCFEDNEIRIEETP